jgi:hypothetical protein
MPTVPKDDVEAHIRSLHDAPTETIRRIGAPPIGPRPTPKAEAPAPPPWEPWRMSIHRPDQVLARGRLEMARIELLINPSHASADLYAKRLGQAERIGAVTDAEWREYFARYSNSLNAVTA